MDPGLSPRAGDWGFSPATMSMTMTTLEPKELPSFTIPLILLHIPGNLKF